LLTFNTLTVARSQALGEVLVACDTTYQTRRNTNTNTTINVSSIETTIGVDPLLTLAIASPRCSSVDGVMLPLSYPSAALCTEMADRLNVAMEVFSHGEYFTLWLCHS
jgi:hypothetical protein